MDDPWGSPWADEVQHEGPVIKKSKGEGEDTKVNADGGGGKGLDVWGADDEDDGFGEWTALPTEEESAGGGLSFDGANDAWGAGHKVEDGRLRNGTLDDHAVPWGDTPTVNGEIIHKLAPGLLPIPPEVMRQPSPDPWSVESTSMEPVHKEGEEVVASVEGLAVNSDDTVIAEPHEMHASAQALPSVGRPNDTPDSTIQGDSTIKDEMAVARPEDARQMESTAKDELVEVAVPPMHGLERSTQKELEIDQESSRPSSSPSDHDEVLPESPRTSFDEDPKRPKLPRKVSSKIEELVERFEGLAQPEIKDGLPSNISRGLPGESADSTKVPADEDQDLSNIKRELLGETNSASNEPEEEDDFDDDFGDFEEGDPEAGEAGEALVGKEEPASKAHPAEQATGDVASESPNIESTIQPTVQPTPDSSPPRHVMKKDFGRVQFTPDASALTNLYPGVNEEVSEKIFIPDVVPHDSFSTVEERKTWYRISRYGTMQKHNAGDDENYVRVKWTQSQVRKDTLKIVARWMEEDRLSGRVVLGGGSKGSSLFGWNDTNAAPVSLASAFAPKLWKKRAPAPAPVKGEPDIPREWPKGLVRSRSTSKTRSPPKPRRRTSSRSKTNSEELKIAPQPVASFGWNSSSQHGTGSPVAVPLAPKEDPLPSKPAVRPRQSSAAKAPVLSPIFSPIFQANQSHSSDFNGLAFLMQPNPSPAPVVPPSATSTLGQNDDWGEMMSSPVGSSPPGFPPSRDLRHKRSRSLKASNTKSQHPPINEDLTSTPSRSGHVSTASLDGILAPKIRTPVTSNRDPSSLDIFDTMATSSPTFQAALPQMNTATPVANGSADPWASADFSFFDTAPKLAPIPIIRPMPEASTSKAVAFATTPIPPPAASRGNGKSKTELEQDTIVDNIVKALPDLSYMLRK